MIVISKHTKNDYKQNLVCLENWAYCIKKNLCKKSLLTKISVTKLFNKKLNVGK